MLVERKILNRGGHDGGTELGRGGPVEAHDRLGLHESRENERERCGMADLPMHASDLDC